MTTLIHVFLPMCIAIMMLSLGLGLTIRDFTRVVQYPKAFLTGLACQFLLAPLMAFGVIQIFGLSGGIAVGFMLLAACPGGAVSNLITKFGRGNVALSVSLTSVSSLMCAVTIPLVLSFAIGFFMADQGGPFDVGRIATNAAIVCVVPICIGILIRHRSVALADRLGQLFAKVSALLLAVIIIAAVAGNISLFLDNVWVLGGALVSLIVVMVGAGYAVSRAAGLGQQNARTISIETGIQNGAFGISVAGMLAQGTAGFSDYALASALYGVMMYFFILPLAWYYRRTPF